MLSCSLARSPCYPSCLCSLSPFIAIILHLPITTFCDCDLRRHWTELLYSGRSITFTHNLLWYNIQLFQCHLHSILQHRKVNPRRDFPIFILYKNKDILPPPYQILLEESILATADKNNYYDISNCLPFKLLLLLLPAYIDLIVVLPFYNNL